MGCEKRPKPTSVSDEPWGIGVMLEDVWIDRREGYEEWEPHIQAMKNNEGNLALRFCYYRRKPDGSRGGFVQSPMWIYDTLLEDLREEARIQKADVILALFQKLSK